MRLVVITNYSDDCTYSFDETVPVIYESAEAFLVDFEKLCLVNKDKSFTQRRFTLGGQQFDAYDYFNGNEFQAPQILTIDEFFQCIEANV